MLLESHLCAEASAHTERSTLNDTDAPYKGDESTPRPTMAEEPMTYWLGGYCEVY